MPEKIGYARVSSTSQSLEVQHERLRAVGCDRTFSETVSARNDSMRRQLTACLDYVREGDALVITRLDRVARSMANLVSIVERLRQKGVNLMVLDQGIDTSTSEGRLLFNMLGAFAEFENDLRKERQLEGINKAKEKGIVFGRPQSLSPDAKAEIRALREGGGHSISKLAQRYRVSPSTVYRAIRDAGLRTNVAS